jgi:ribosomal-protein-alanine N-acetyltransferase
MARDEASLNGTSDEERKCEAWPALRIRRASSSDLPFVFRLSDLVFRTYGPYGQILPVAFLQSRVLTLVAHERDRRVGFVMLSPVVEKGSGDHMEVELSALAVQPKFQRRGAGRALLREAIRLVGVRGASGMILHTAEENIHARRLFLSEGFVLKQAVGGYYPNGQTALRMHRVLKKSG